MIYIAGGNRAVDTGDTYFEVLKTTLSQQVLTIRKLIKRKALSTNPPLFARVNHGRWVVSCPNCNNVEFAFEDGLFFCSQCNDEVRQVVLPDKRKQIEGILGKRAIKNRHWQPTETIENLLTENVKHGIEEA